MKKLFKIIYYIILSYIIFIGIILVVSLIPVTGNIKTLAVLSGSMEPTIHTGSVVIVKPESSYKVGDIITFGDNTKTDIPTTHRIAEERAVEGNMIYRTKGDANNAEDSAETPQKEVTGRVLFSIPYLGYIINFIKKPIGLMLIIIVPAAVVIYDEMRKIRNEVKKIKSEKNKFTTEKLSDENT
ncbi:MAG: signal peptidase I [Patescibacteria group bacterium]|nr:signal peptidase I [Patescibacteria group bacterium]